MRNSALSGIRLAAARSGADLNEPPPQTARYPDEFRDGTYCVVDRTTGSRVFDRRATGIRRASGACSSTISSDKVPDVRDGLTREQRVVLHVLGQLQKERGDANVPTAMLWGRVCEYFYNQPQRAH